MIVAYILVDVDIGSEHDVVREILDKYGNLVTEARVTYGEHDLVVRVEVPSMRALDMVVSGIRSIKGVRKTTTLIAS
ncbi:MAG: Lrp/AsnC ligand binding domain-containing protein [Desulfurococcales archaeon]|nr:Lrp/AsnC ligand binding domain-containing protein [Desulfurococcales archaeon]MEB3778836.1 Lrp/AsnC ligand binding domain-containing protein [Desulfurococcales archaeon]